MKTRMLAAVGIFLGLVIAGLLPASAAVGPRFNLVKPSTTGVPGEEVRVMKLDPSGNLWIAGRFYFWGEGGIAKLPAKQMKFKALPGGGFDTGAWQVWSSVQHPIPSVYINDMVFGANGIIWIASDGGLTRFDPAAKSQSQMWLTYNTTNSPLILNEVRSLALDSQGNLWLTNVNVQTSNGALFQFNPASNVWTEYRVGTELPWSPPWYNVNDVFVGSDDRVWLTHSVLGGMAEVRWGFMGPAQLAVSNGRDAVGPSGKYLGHDRPVWPFQMEWSDLAQLANLGRNYHDDRPRKRSRRHTPRFHVVRRCL